MGSVMDQPRPWERDYDAGQEDPPVRTSQRFRPQPHDKLKLIAETIQELTYREMAELSGYWAMVNISAHSSNGERFLAMADNILKERPEK